MEKETVGNRIKRLRKMRKMSVIDIANKIGVSRSNIYRYESDEIEKMPYTTLVPIARALGVTPTFLLTGKEVDPNNYSELVSRLQSRVGDVKFTDDELSEIVTYVEFILMKRK